MNTTTVKICGLKNTETVRAIRHLPIDHIGFVFAESRRRISPEHAKELIAALREDGAPPPPSDNAGALPPSEVCEPEARGRLPLTAGVFVNPSIGELAQVLDAAPLDIVQLHGTETPEFCREVRKTFGVRVFKTVAVDPSALRGGNASDAAASRLDPYLGAIDAVLLDTYDPAAAGGTGRTFAWECIPLYLAWTRRHGLPLIVAGGLHAENVRELIDRYGPDGVDVSSGVETSGEKDIEKIATFVEKVKGR